MSKISVDEITDEAGTGAPDFPNGISATGPFTSLGIDDNATSTAITVTSAGKIGIGTGGPRANLGILDSGGADDDFNLLVTGFRPNIVLEDASSSATDYQLRADSGSLEFRSGDASTNTKLTTERMRINPAGNVGIGTASPTEKLDVAGTVKATSFSGDGSALTGVASEPWTSNSIAWVKDTPYTISHSLGVVPKLFTIEYVCKVAVFGYAVGESLFNMNERYNNWGQIVHTPTSSSIKISMLDNGILIRRKDSQSTITQATSSNFDVRINLLG